MLLLGVLKEHPIDNLKGAEWVAEEFNVDELVIMKSKAFHLDTLFTPVLNKENRLAAVIACTSLMENDSVNNLKSFAKYQRREAF